MNNVPASLSNLRHVFQWGRIQNSSDWLAPAALFALLAIFAAYWCLRDSRELSKAWGLLFTLLRVGALACVLGFFLEPEWRSEQLHVQRSQVIVLADASQSMGLIDVGENTSRSEQLAKRFAESDFLTRLRQTHDVVVKRFEGKVETITRLPCLAEGSVAPSAVSPVPAIPPVASNEGKVQLDWSAALNPGGQETRIGDAISQTLAESPGAPLAGVLVIGDGQNNGGLAPETAAAAAGEAKTPIHTLGVGELTRPADVRINDIAAPSRAYPKDRFKVTGYVQTAGMAGRDVAAELYSWDPTRTPRAERLEQTVHFSAAEDDVITTLPLELDGAATSGRRTFELRLPELPNESFKGDNKRQFDVEFVDRKTQVLLIAGGPTREYIFLRNALYRDKEIELDVWLQGTDPQISQDARKILTGFPQNRAELYSYDLVIAIDADWRKLSPEQVALLETFVAEQAGGLLLTAGPIYTDNWLRDERYAKLKALYPVRFHDRFSSRIDNEYGSKTPLPLLFTSEGLESEFLWLADTTAASEAVWKTFPGVYGFFNVDGAKDSATIYSYCADPDLGAPNQERIYMAGQLYGAGRVFYQASGEIWRTRSLDVNHFTNYYTKLIRYLTQGRLLRGSSRGLLIVERDRYMKGELVQVRAQLTDSRLEPLAAPDVVLNVASPSNSLQSVKLAADLSRPGLFAGQFVPQDEGLHTLLLAIPESEDEILSRRVDVRIPDRERQDPRRNVDLLKGVAERSGGRYFASWDAAIVGEDSRPSLMALLPDKTQSKYVAGPPNLDWQRQLNTWLLAAFAGCLALEWLIRRLKKLA